MIRYDKSNKLMNAALVLYRQISAEETDDFMKCVGDDFNTKHYRKRRLASSKLWHWSLERWGMTFSAGEYDERETGALREEYLLRKNYLSIKNVAGE